MWLVVVRGARGGFSATGVPAIYLGFGRRAGDSQKWRENPTYTWQEFGGKRGIGMAGDFEKWRERGRCLPSLARDLWMKDMNHMRYER